jgi:hypothetical protein
VYELKGDRHGGHFTPINCKETKNVAKEIVLWARENEKSSAELTVGRRGSGVALVSQVQIRRVLIDRHQLNR